MSTIEEQINLKRMEISNLWVVFIIDTIKKDLDLLANVVTITSNYDPIYNGGWSVRFLNTNNEEVSMKHKDFGPIEHDDWIGQMVNPDELHASLDGWPTISLQINVATGEVERTPWPESAK